MEHIRTAPSAVDLALFADLFDAHAADIVTRLNEEDADTAAAVLAHLPLERAIDTFDRPELTRAGNLLLDQPSERAGEILKGMADDRAADVLRELDGDDRAGLLKHVDRDSAGPLKSLLAYGVVLYDGADIVPFGDRLAAAPLSLLWN